MLRQLGHDVLTTQQSDQSGEGIPDPAVLGFAISDKRAILTINRRDFLRLHRASQEHCGIIVCTVDQDFARQAERIHAAIEKAESIDGQLIRVNRPPK
ncbi:MAG: DUF5615 family PIN-like protein [Planctomycetaceae bacterium]|nr:DUF5615 family PIN-like protein [Planctomycetaceae bacterium]